MQLLRWLRGLRNDSADEADPDGRLDAQARHLNGRISKMRGEIRRLWTEYRRTADPDQQKALKRDIKTAEAKRNALVKPHLGARGVRRLRMRAFGMSGGFNSFARVADPCVTVSR